MGVWRGSLVFSVAVVVSLVVLVQQVEKSAALKCYACPTKEYCSTDKGELKACTQKEPVCYEYVKRKPVLDQNGKEQRQATLKGCMGKADMDPKYKNLVGCTYRTEYTDFCVCLTDRCNPGDDWPPRNDSTSN